MRGFKAFSSIQGELICRDYFYKVGREEVLPDTCKPVMCRCGFHFCRRLFEVFGWYPISLDTRVCEVEATGKVVVRKRGSLTEGKCVTDRLKVVRMLSCDEILEQLEKEADDRRISFAWRSEINYRIRSLRALYPMMRNST